MANQNISKTENIVTLLIAIAIFTVLGLICGLLSSVFAPQLGIPMLSLGAFVALWWATLIFITVASVLFVLVFRATDPLTRLMDNPNQFNVPQKKENDE